MAEEMDPDAGEVGVDRGDRADGVSSRVFVLDTYTQSEMLDVELVGSNFGQVGCMVLLRANVIDR
ncbi:hypothetical protein [Nocardia fluminea]|uniref:hypothetical protein n=1 Tax=Nocardia fluminea TaxID=134984 RepID=UPI003658E666